MEATPQKAQRDKVKAMFGSIARGYDLLNHTLSFGLDILWRKALVRAMGGLPGGPLLDLAAGTLDVTLALARAYPGRDIYAGDLSLEMLRAGLPKARKARERAARKQAPLARVRPVAADAMALPFPDACLAGVSVAFGLRNMVPRGPALAEMLRVLKPGGKLCVLEFGSARPRVWFGLYNFYLARVLPRIGGLVSGDRQAYEYLAATIRDFPLAGELAEELRASGFDGVEYSALSGGIVYLHQGRKAG